MAPFGIPNSIAVNIRRRLYFLLKRPLIHRDKADRGAALLVVIMVVLVASFLASQLIMQVRTELRVAANMKNRAVSQLLSEAGVNLALFRLLGDSPEEEGAAYVKFLPGQVYENELPTGRTRYSAVNESGKIDLNTAPRPLLELLLQYLQLDAGEVEMIIDSLMDWRDSDDLHRLQGAESEFYLNLDEPYIPRNGPLQDPAELFLIRGAGTLRDRLVPEDLFTVHNAGGGINFNNLTPALLDFLVEGDRLKEEAYRQALEMHGNLNKDKALEILGEERYELLEQFLSFDSRNPYFTIDSVGIAGDGGEQAEQEQDRAGIRTKVRIRIIGSVVHYLSWMEDHEK